MSDAAQIEQQLSMQAAQLMRAAIMIARALAAREAAARRAAARTSLEHARALRTVTEQQRRLAAPLYRAARREGWWDDPKVSAAERARAVGLATRFEHIDEDARAVALEARQRLERQAQARAQEQERARMAARNPETFRDSGKEAFIDMTLVSVAEIAAAAPSSTGKSSSNPSRKSSRKFAPIRKRRTLSCRIQWQRMWLWPRPSRGTRSWICTRFMGS